MSRAPLTPLLLLIAILMLSSVAVAEPGDGSEEGSEGKLSVEEKVAFYAMGERPSQAPALLETPLPRSPAKRFVHRGFQSVQVNIDGAGMNIVGDAANEPSLTVDPTNSDRVAIGWRQFDAISSNFREAGWGYSDDGGASWTADEIDSGIFRSDPVLDSDRSGGFYYNSLTIDGPDLSCDVFRSGDGGVSWGSAIAAAGGDKQWMAVDRTLGTGSGHIYTNWNRNFSCCGATDFTRSTDGGTSYEAPVAMSASVAFATVAVGNGGEVYIAGETFSGITVVRSTSLNDAGQAMSFDGSTVADLGGSVGAFGGSTPNPAGLLGQVWVATDPSRQDHVYVLASVDPGGSDPLDVRFTRSTDGGLTWSPSIRVNRDVGDHWNWFGTLAVAPNGRLDVIWNDNRDDPTGFDSKLYYASSMDAGVTWSASQEMTPAFDPHVGWPQQNKIGDYYDMISENDQIHIAYAATFNGEQDVYYLKIELDAFIFADGFEGGDTMAWSASMP